MKLNELNTVQQARAEINAGPDRAERIDQARMSDQQLVAKRAKELQQQTADLENSKDPIDIQLLSIKRQIANLQKKADALMQRKQRQSQTGV